MPLAAAGAGDLEHDADAPEFLIGPLATRRPERPVTCSVQDGLVRRAVALSGHGWRVRVRWAGRVQSLRAYVKPYEPLDPTWNSENNGVLLTFPWAVRR